MSRGDGPEGFCAGFRLNYNKCITKYFHFQQWGGSAAFFPCQLQALLAVALSPGTGGHCLVLQHPCVPGSSQGSHSPRHGTLWHADLGWLAIRMDLDSHNSNKHQLQLRQAGEQQQQQCPALDTAAGSLCTWHPGSWASNGHAPCAGQAPRACQPWDRTLTQSPNSSDPSNGWPVLWLSSAWEQFPAPIPWMQGYF